jgi:hypothetical protein
MRCHSCDAWVESRMTHCAICGWRVDARAEEPLPSLPKPRVTSKISPAPTDSRVMVVKEVHRLVTIGISATHIACPDSIAEPASHGARTPLEPEQCLQLEPRLLEVGCLFGERCELIDPLPGLTVWKPKERVSIRRGKSERPKKGQSPSGCPPKWKRLTTLGLGDYVARCTKNLRVRETRTQLRWKG